MPAAAKKEPFLPDLLIRNRSFVLLWAAYFIAAFGDNFNDLAQLSLLEAMEGEQATRLMALMMFGLFTPYVVLGPLAGWCADRFSRKWTMITADLVRACIVVNFATLIPLLRSGGLGPYTVMLTQMMLGMLAVFFSPARQAMLPTLVRHDQLVRANALISALAPIGAMLGFLAGGFVVQYISAVWNFRVNSVTYVISALLVLSILVPHHRRSLTPRQSSVLGPLLKGFDYVRGHRRVGQMILLGAVFWGAAGVVYSCVPAIVKELVSDRYDDVGIYRALPAIGMALGAALMSLIGPPLGVVLAILVGLVLAAAGLVGLAVAFVLKLGAWAAASSLVIVGLAGSMLLVTIMATLQRLVPDSRRGRVFGVSDMTTMGAMVVATGALGLTPIPDLDRYVPLILGLTSLSLLVSLGVAWRVYRGKAWLTPMPWLIWHLIRFYAGFWVRARRMGPCRIPRRGPVILASNHTCGIDPVVILATNLHRATSFLVAEEYYRVPGARWMMDQVRCVPINRTSPRKSFLVNSLGLLESGGCLVVFPQGTYEVPGAPPPPNKAGVGVLALRSGATIIPCHISGTRYSRNPFLAYLRRHNARIRYGEPIDLSAYRDNERDKDTAQRVSDLIMQRIRELAPQDREHGDHA